MPDLWMPGAEVRRGPADKVGYAGFGASSPKRGDVKHSAEGSASGLLTVLNGARRASWHFSVLKVGTIWQHYPADANCWHAGDVDADDDVRANVDLVGIEHEGMAGQSLTAAQVKATADISQWCAEQFGRDHEFARFPVQPADGWTLVEHNEVSNTPTACPSNRIPWPLVMVRLEKKEEMTDKVFVRDRGFVFAERMDVLFGHQITVHWYIRTQAEIDDMVAHGWPSTIHSRKPRGFRLDF